MAKRTPKYALHRATGQAYVRINRRFHYLGEHDSPESHKRYEALIAKWLGSTFNADRETLTTSRLCIMYVDFARVYYWKDGQQTSEVSCIQLALKPLVAMFGREQISRFGPKKLTAVREEMVRLDWARTTINQSIRRITRMLRWAAANEHADASICEQCRMVAGLRQGRSKARETDPILPVPQPDVDAVELFVSRQIWSMIQLQLLTGMRPGEVCMVKACDIDMTSEVWEYRPQTHKTAHHGRKRFVFIGPRGQEILRPYLATAKDEEYLFRPDAAENVRQDLRKASRQSPMTPSQAKRKRKEAPKRTPGERYQRTSYTRAIARACRLAKVTEWSPNQLRHNSATRLAKDYGIEGTRIILGHSKADMTQIYAEIDYTKARQIMLSAG